MKKSSGLLFWLPRILCILAILFISLFALDSFDPGLTFRQQLTGFLMHMIPSLVLLGILVLAWKRELWGGIIFILLGLGFSPFIYSHNFSMNHSFWASFRVLLLITLPFVLIGALFIISHFRSKKQSS